MAYGAFHLSNQHFWWSPGPQWQGIWWPCGGCVEQGYMHPHLRIHHPNWHPQENPRTEEAWRLNYGLTPRGGPSRSELRHIGRAVWRILHCCYPCWTCSMDKVRTLVSSAVKLASFTSTKFTFKRKKKKKEIQFWLYIRNFQWLRQLTGQQSTLLSLVLQREGGSSRLPGKATALRHGDYQQPSSQTIPNTSLARTLQDHSWVRQQGFLQCTPSRP